MHFQLQLWSTFFRGKVNVLRKPNGDPASSLSGLVHHIYVCDTHTGWIAAGSLSKAHLEACIASVRAMPADEREALPDAASTLVVRAADAGPIAMTMGDEGLGTYALKTAMADMTLRRTFELMMPAANGRDAREIHWVQVVYRLADNSHVIRPVAAGGDPRSSGLFPHESLIEMISSVVRADLDPASNASAARMIRDGGGTEVHDSLLPSTTVRERGF